MGSGDQDPLAYNDEKPLHRVFVPEFQIARTLITNAQYALYVQATGANAPRHWENGQPPQGKLDHPVVSVSWYDALDYCEWLSQMTEKDISLPSEAEWEKAARGIDGREYPWGNDWQENHANTEESRIGHASAVGCFPQGASPYACQDMAGNVWEWTRSTHEPYLYPTDPKEQAKREDLHAGHDNDHMLRGGSAWENREYAHCVLRLRTSWHGHDDYGFRLVVGPRLGSGL